MSATAFIHTRTVKLDPETNRALDETAAFERTSISDVIRRAIRFACGAFLPDTNQLPPRTSIRGCPTFGSVAELVAASPAVEVLAMASRAIEEPTAREDVIGAQVILAQQFGYAAACLDRIAVALMDHDAPFDAEDVVRELDQARAHCAYAVTSFPRIGAYGCIAPWLADQALQASRAEAEGERIAVRSDARTKADIVRDGLDDATGVPICTFRYADDPKSYPKVVGPLAQDIAVKFPDAVFEAGGLLAVLPEKLPPSLRKYFVVEETAS